MTKRLIELDDELLAEAQRELGTTGISETVRAAMRFAAAGAARARQVQWLTESGQEPMSEPEQRAAAEVLDLDGRSDIAKAPPGLNRQAAEERMAQSVDEFYGDSTPPSPLGVVPAAP